MANIGVGKGGKTFQDRQKTALLRNEVIDAVSAILKDDPSVEQWSDYKKRVVERLASTVLPRLNEHTGADGADLKIVFDPVFNASPSSPEGNSGEQ
jgi:hypothetical protein